MSLRFPAALSCGVAVAAASMPSRAGGPPDPAPIPLRISVFNETIALPSATRMFTSWNPGAEVGSELRYRHTPGYTLFQSFDLGFFHHRGFSSSAYVLSAFGVRPTLFEGLFAEASLGVGYLAHFSELALHDVDAEGRFRRSSSWLHRFAAQGTLAIGYNLRAFSPFLAYSVMVEAPFFDAYSPVVPHQMIKLGARVDLPSLSGKK